MTEHQLDAIKELHAAAEQTTLFLKNRNYPETYMTRFNNALKVVDLILWPTLLDGTPRV